MILASLLSSSSFIMTNKILIKALGIDAAIIIGELCSEYTYWEERKQLKDGEWFFSTRENIEENTGLSEHRQRMAITLLLNLKLLEVKKMGLPCKTYYKLNENNILTYYSQNQKKLPKLYKNSVVKKIDNKELKYDTSSNLKVEEQDIQKFNSKESKSVMSSDSKFEELYIENFNNNKNNKNNKNHTQVCEFIREKKQYKPYVSMTEKEYNNLIEAYGNEKTQQLINELNLYKQANGKEYEDDYAAILLWVVKRVEEQEKNKINPTKNKKILSVKDLEFNQSRCSDEELAKKYEDLYDN